MPSYRKHTLTASWFWPNISGKILKTRNSWPFSSQSWSKSSLVVDVHQLKLHSSNKCSNRALVLAGPFQSTSWSVSSLKIRLSRRMTIQMVVPVPVVTTSGCRQSRWWAPSLGTPRRTLRLRRHSVRTSHSWALSSAKLCRHPTHGARKRRPRRLSAWTYSSKPPES